MVTITVVVVVIVTIVIIIIAIAVRGVENFVVITVLTVAKLVVIDLTGFQHCFPHLNTLSD